MTAALEAMHESPRRPIVLVMMGAFWPGNDSSGPNQSLKSLATMLKPWFDFRIVARDRPFGAFVATARTGEWIDLGYARARYCEAGQSGSADLSDILTQTPHDIVWMNGFFDREFTLPTLRLRRTRRIDRKPAILSPRGEFGAGALGLKSARKRAYIAAVRWLGLLRGVTLHATSDAVSRDILGALPWAEHVAVAPNVRELLTPPAFVTADNDAIRIAFVGRISPVKQLHFALDVLSRVKSRATFDIYGPAQDEAYWRRCQAQIAALPPRVQVRWHGETANTEVVTAMGRSDLFFLPTAGENFGHAIFEALCCRTPVLISDRTPWRDLERANAGWDLSLDDPEAFAAVIDRFAATSAATRRDMGVAAREMAESWIANGDGVARNRAMLSAVLSANTEASP